LDNRYKVLVTGFIPYLTVCGGLWNWAYWSTFDINIFVFIDVTDIVKSFIIPLLSSAIFFIVGQVLAWFFFQQRLPYGGGADSRPGIFLRKYSKLFAFIWLALIATLLIKSDEPYRWISSVMMIIPLMLIPAVESGLLAESFPDRNLRATILTTIILVPFLSFAQGKMSGELIYKNRKFKTLDKETIRQVRPNDTLDYKFLGLAGNYVFGLSPDNKTTLIMLRSELKEITTKE
jgi:hypothetical protein